jgi:hypothetical protein
MKTLKLKLTSMTSTSESPPDRGSYKKKKRRVSYWHQEVLVLALSLMGWGQLQEMQLPEGARGSTVFPVGVEGSDEDCGAIGFCSACDHFFFLALGAFIAFFSLSHLVSTSHSIWWVMALKGAKSCFTSNLQMPHLGGCISFLRTGDFGGRHSRNGITS